MIQDISPLKYDITYKKPQPCKDDIIFVFEENCIMCRFDGENVVFPTRSEINYLLGTDTEDSCFLFSVDSVNYFYMTGCAKKIEKEFVPVEKSKFRELRPVHCAFEAVTAYQIYNWYRNNKFCGKCGSPNRPHHTDRAMECTACKYLRYPQICPSVIVGIINEDKILLTKYALSRGKFKRFSLVAGYNEIGETLEDTARREVMEEVGLKIKNLTYFKSQPWSFTDSLLVGFFCELDGDGTVSIDEDELSVAQWFSREEIPDDSADPTISLTGTMIYTFKNSKTKEELLG